MIDFPPLDGGLSITDLRVPEHALVPEHDRGPGALAVDRRAAGPWWWRNRQQPRRAPWWVCARPGCLCCCDECGPTGVRTTEPLAPLAPGYLSVESLEAGATNASMNRLRSNSGTVYLGACSGVAFLELSTGAMCHCGETSVACRGPSASSAKPTPTPRTDSPATATATTAAR